jgi:hypothetical protein
MNYGSLTIIANMTPSRANPARGASAPKGWSNMKFIREAELAGFEMHNLADDPGEASDMKSNQPEMYATMLKRFIALHAEIAKEGPTIDVGPNDTGKRAREEKE